MVWLERGWIISVARRHVGTIHGTQADGLADNFVLALYEDDDGVLWIATHNGLNRLPSAPPSSTSARNVISNGLPGAGRGGTRRDRFFTFTTAHGLLDNLINHILEDG